MKSFMVTHAIFLIYVFLDACVTSAHSKPIDKNLTHELTHAFFLVSNLIPKVIWSMICIPTILLHHAVLFSMKTIFLLSMKDKLPTQITILPLQHPSQIIIPFFSLYLHLLLPHPYPLTTLIIINRQPYDAHLEINTLLPIFKIIIVFSLQ